MDERLTLELNSPIELASAGLQLSTLISGGVVPKAEWVKKWCLTGLVVMATNKLCVMLINGSRVV